MRAMLVCTVCGDRMPDADVENEGVSLGAPCVWGDCDGMFLDPWPPQHTLNAVIVAAMLSYAYRPPRHEWQRDAPSADPSWRGWCDMLPLVTAAAPASDPLCPGDVWWVEVQYNSQGSRAAFGVDRNNVPQCYQD